MIKIFVSYSHRDDTFVKNVVEILGRDRVFLDDYSFSPAASVDDSIKEHIRASNVFVAFMSNESLTSPWAIEERHFVRDFVFDDKIAYCPVIIDPDVSASSDLIENWEKKYLIVYNSSSRTIARFIQNHIARLISNKNVFELPFVGRDGDLSTLEEKAFSQINVHPKAVIVSGWPKIGRKRLLQEFISQKLFNGARGEYSPIQFQLKPNDSIEDFIAYLNTFVELFSESERIDVSKTKDTAKDAAVDLLKRVSENRERLIIDDDKCIVSERGQLVDWFIDIIQSPDLPAQINLFVASRYSVKTGPTSSNLIVDHRLDALKKKEMVTLFNRYGTQRNIECDSDTVEEVISQLTYPEQIRLVINIIKNKDIVTAKKELNNIILAFDTDARQFFDSLSGDRDLIQAINVLAQTSVLSYQVLSEVFSSDIADKVFEELDKYALLNRFGLYNQYVSLDRTLADYVSRKKIKIASDVKKKLDGISRRLLEGFTVDELDLSEQLYGIRRMILSDEEADWSKYLIPSYALRVMIDEYNKEKYDVVVKVADRILQGYQARYYESIIRSLRYWKCLSLCRLSDNRLLSEVDYFNNQSKNGGYSYNFLLGFYYRNIGSARIALGYLNKALENKADNALLEMSYSKAEHEKVIVLMQLRRFEDALNLARKNYDKHSDNPYNVDAYFRCLVKSKDPDKDTLQKLMSEMRAFETAEAKTLQKVFKAEYSYYIEGDYNTAVSILAPLSTGPNTRSLGIVNGSLQEINKREKQKAEKALAPKE